MILSVNSATFLDYKDQGKNLGETLEKKIITKRLDYSTDFLTIKCPCTRQLTVKTVIVPN